MNTQLKQRLSGDEIRAVMLANSQRLLSDEFRVTETKIQTKSKVKDLKLEFINKKLCAMNLK